LPSLPDISSSSSPLALVHAAEVATLARLVGRVRASLEGLLCGTWSNEEADLVQCLSSGWVPPSWGEATARAGYGWGAHPGCLCGRPASPALRSS